MTSIEALADSHGHAVDDFASVQLGYIVRKLVFEKTYLIHYHIDDIAGLVKVVNFRHGARLPLGERE